MYIHNYSVTVRSGIHYKSLSAINFITVITAIAGVTCSGTDLRRLTCYLHYLCECLTDIIVLIAYLNVFDDICVTKYVLP